MDYNIQVLKSIKTLVLVNLDQAETIAKLDSLSLSTQSGRYIKENCFSYYVLLNVWGHQICSHASEEAWVYIWLRVQQRGLIPVIKEASELADMIIHGEAPDWDYTYGYFGALAREDYSVATERLVHTLLILRFPKRFSPKYADIVLQRSLADFLSLNTRLKTSNLHEPCWFWMRSIRSKVHDILKGFDYDPTDGYFSSGTTSCTTKILAKKLVAYAKTEPCIAYMSQYQLSSASGAYARWRNTPRLRDSVVVQAVPKSYKAARMIAKEPPVSAFFLQAIARGMDRAVKRNGYGSYVDVQDQDVSQELCRQGSIDGKYATIDLTSASDTITESFARSVFPSEVIHAIDQYRCAYLTAGKETRVMQMFATSGSPITFISESIVFCSIAIVATEYVSRNERHRLLPPRVYGDDIIIDDRACVLCCEILKECGFLPNASKTFSGATPLGYYRESCGAEYLNGYPMHHAYYPRRPVLLEPEGLASLCELQHKLYGNWKIRMFLAQVVVTLEPRMTSHPQGEPCEDLWDNLSSGIAVSLGNSDSPHAIRHKHLSLKAKVVKPTTSDEEMELLNMWYYYQYLKNGPLYGDTLQEVLRVSISRKRFVADSNQSTFSWNYRIE